MENREKSFGKSIMKVTAVFIVFYVISTIIYACAVEKSNFNIAIIIVILMVVVSALYVFVGTKMYEKHLKKIAIGYLKEMQTDVTEQQEKLAKELGFENYQKLIEFCLDIKDDTNKKE